MTMVYFALPSLCIMVPLNATLDRIDGARCLLCCSFGDGGITPEGI